MHDLQTIVRLNRQPVSQKTPALAKANQISNEVSQECLKKRADDRYRCDILEVENVEYT